MHRLLTICTALTTNFLHTPLGHLEPINTPMRPRGQDYWSTTDTLYWGLWYGCLPSHAVYCSLIQIVMWAQWGTNCRLPQFGRESKQSHDSAAMVEAGSQIFQIQKIFLLPSWSLAGVCIILVPAASLIGDLRIRFGFAIKAIMVALRLCSDTADIYLKVSKLWANKRVSEQQTGLRQCYYCYSSNLSTVMFCCLSSNKDPLSTTHYVQWKFCHWLQREQDQAFNTLISNKNYSKNYI